MCNAQFSDGSDEFYDRFAGFGIYYRPERTGRFKENRMKRYPFFLLMIGAVLACNLFPPAATEQPAVTDTAISPVHLETESPIPVATETSAEPDAPEGMTTVWVYYSDASTFLPVAVARFVPATDNQAVLVHSTLKELVKGPTEAEKNSGLYSWFSAETTGTVIGMAAAGGDFTADFTGWKTLIPNASTSAGSQILLSELNSTMFQFDFVYIVNYTLDGDCAAFWEWLQMGCHPVTRAEWEAG